MAVDLLDFKADLSHISPTFWVLLGDAASKAEQISAAPLLPEVRAKMHLVYLIRGVRATTAIEGNTLTEDEVRRQIERSLDLPPSREYLGREIDNIVRAINALVEEPRQQNVSLDDLCRYNAMVLEGLEVAEGVFPGQLRTINVGVASYRCPDFQKVPELTLAFVDWFNRFPIAFFERMETQTAVIKAVLTHLYFVLIHPFGDGNGRTGRFLEWRVLDHAGIPTAATHLLSNHYNQTRAEYYRQLEKVSKTGELADFLEYAVRGFVDQLSEQLEFIKQQQYQLAYLRHVHEAFTGDKSQTGQRRRELAVAIQAAPEPVEAASMRTLSSSLAQAYGAKTNKTITRDLNALLDANLIIQLPEGKFASTIDRSVFRHVRKRVLRGASSVRS